MLNSSPTRYVEIPSGLCGRSIIARVDTAVTHSLIVKLHGRLSPMGETRVVTKHGSFKAKLDTKYEGGRHYITCTTRGDDEQRASDDLLRIRAYADGASTRFGGLQAMRITPKFLHDGAKTSWTHGLRSFQGGIEEGSTYSNRARNRYRDEGFACGQGGRP